MQAVLLSNTRTNSKESAQAIHLKDEVQLIDDQIVKGNSTKRRVES